MKAKDARQLVVDADVARSAGNVYAIARESTCCRDFLMAMRTIGHFIVMTPALTEEWTKHRSRFSSTWLTRMQQSGKVKMAKGDAYSGLEHQIKGLKLGVNQEAAMLKDKHLIAAAVETDRRIVSKDDSARALYRKHSVSLVRTNDIVWVNPVNAGESPIEWLKSGCAANDFRKLGIPES